MFSFTIVTPHPHRRGIIMYVINTWTHFHTFLANDISWNFHTECNRFSSFFLPFFISYFFLNVSSYCDESFTGQFYDILLENQRFKINARL